MNSFLISLRKLFLKCLQVSVAISLLASCENEASSDDFYNAIQTGVNVNKLTSFDAENASFTTNLMAGQHHVAGTLNVSADSTNVYVAYNANCSYETGSWTLKATHLYVGDCASIPTTGAGNPKIGRFPYNAEHGNGVSEYTYTIPLSEIDSCFCLAAHAEVDCGGECDDSEVSIEEEANGYCGEETAWAEGNQFPGNSWAMYIEFCMEEGEEEEVAVDEEVEEEPAPEEEVEEEPVPEEEEETEEILFD